MKKLFVFLLCALAASSCAHDIIDLTGDIQGVVKDFDSGQFLENSEVSLSPGGRSASTDANGIFVFDELEPNTYTLSFSKSGYSDKSQEVVVVSEQISRINVFLKKVSSTTGSITGIIKSIRIK